VLCGKQLKNSPKSSFSGILDRPYQPQNQALGAVKNLNQLSFYCLACVRFFCEKDTKGF